jgi:hypothetical protein
MALSKAKVDAFQISQAELKLEVEHGLEARRQLLAADLPDEDRIARAPE